MSLAVSRGALFFLLEVPVSSPAPPTLPLSQQNSFGKIDRNFNALETVPEEFFLMLESD